MVPLLLVLAVGWSDFPDAPPATKTRPPKSSQRREALEEFQTLLGQWQKERLDFAREQDLQLKAEGALEHSRGEPSDLAEPVHGFKKVVEVKKPTAGSTRTGRGKVIEFAPREKLKCAAQKHQREKAESANDAFEEAIEVNFEKRRAQIEAEAAKIQAAVNEARAREANRQAKKIGGTIDEEGNFEDDELKAEPPPRKPD
ncbi:MAG: hypothetical protein H6Q89_2985 [Myxococcaceae bacterium]|nr:hypothetical protein [Myxococcaceae bacterium]